MSSYDFIYLNHLGFTNPYAGSWSETRLVAIDNQGNELVSNGGFLSLISAGFDKSAVAFLDLDILQLYCNTGAVASGQVRFSPSGSYITDDDLFSEASTVPVPASALLLVSSLFGLVGLSRHKRATGTLA